MPDNNRSSYTTLCLVSPCPPPLGGMAIQAGKLASCMERGGIHVITVRTNTIFPGMLSWVRHIPFLRTVLNSILFLIQLNKELQSCDLVYFLTGFIDFFFWITLPGIILIKIRGKKLILNARGGGAANFFDHWKYIAGPFIRMADMITTPSLFLKAVFVRYFGIVPEIVPNIADFNQFEFMERKKLSPRLIVTRSLEEIYNVECVIRAFKLIHDKIPESKLDILGNGSLRQDLENKVRDWNLSDSVKFHGVVPHNMIQKYYRNSDIFINASNVDNLPGTILEAFACGLPVVSTNAGGIPYMVEHKKTGLLVERNDHQALADQVFYLLENQREALLMVKNARRECETYSEESVRKILLSLFLKVTE